MSTPIVMQVNKLVLLRYTDGESVVLINLTGKDYLVKKTSVIPILRISGSLASVVWEKETETARAASLSNETLVNPIDKLTLIAEEERGRRKESEQTGGKKTSGSQSTRAGFRRCGQIRQFTTTIMLPAL